MARTTTVPAQITTVEDKIIGSLGMIQLVLLGGALLGSGALFLCVPPANSTSVFKVVLMVVMDAFLCASAFRYKGELLLKWGVLGLHYAIRPSRWIYDKNSMYLRPPSDDNRAKTTEATVEIEEVAYAPIDTLNTPERVRVERLMGSSSANVRYINTKGGLKIVYSTEPQTS